MGGNVIYSSALQAPLALSNPSGQVNLAGQFLAGSGQQSVMPPIATLSMLTAPAALAWQMGIPGTALNIAGTVATLLRGSSGKITASVGSTLLAGLSPTLAIGPPPQRPPGQVVWAPGHYVHFDALYWQNSDGSAGNQQIAFNAFIAGLVANANVQGCIIYLTWNQLEGAQGDYSNGTSIVSSILSAVRSQSQAAGRQASDPFMVGFVGPLPKINSGGGATDQTNPNNWPQYVIANNWTVSTNGVNGGNGGSQINFTAACLSAITAVNQHYGDLFSQDPNLAFWAPSDTSTFYLQSQIPAVQITSSTMLATYMALIKSTKDRWPNAPVLAKCDNFPNGATDASTFFNTLWPYSPGGIWFGGPDPGVANTIAQQVFRGAAGTTGDLRGKAVWVDMVQENFNLAPPPPSTFTPAAGYTFTGTFADGQTCRIGRPGAFGTKPFGSKPLWLWNPGKTGSTALDVNSRTQAWATDTGHGPQFGSIKTTPVAPGSSFCYEVNSSNAVPPSPGAGVPANIDGMDFHSAVDLYVHEVYETSFNYTDLNGGADWNLKGIRVWDSGFFHDMKTGFGDTGNDPTNKDNMVLLYENTDQGANHDNFGGQLPKGQYMPEEYTIHQGSNGVADTVTVVWQFGKKLTTYTNVGFLAGTFSGRFTRLYSHQFQSLPGGLLFRYDLFYADDSLCRLIVSDQSSWNDAVTRGVAIQIPTNWTTDFIDFTARQGMLGSLVGKYLYAMLSDGTVIGPLGNG